MAKRTSRRARKSTSSSAALSRVRSASSSPSEPTSPEQLQSQYQYVIDDLKRIGIIAAVLIAGLISLSFFLK